ncbi:M48 family metalloprotease [Micromonospora sp. DT47]|uniref:M48 family metalloprotease n=1 Tax=Micromonospora sp. DT47 TaxID=3393431 RepID=UPI003CEE4940
MTESPPAVRTAEPPADPPQSPSRITNRPPGYPSALVWLRGGILRDWRGVVGAFVATWFYLPLALLLAVIGGISLGIGGLVAGGSGAADQLPSVLRDTPLIGSLIDAAVTGSGGVLGGIVGFGLGFVGGIVLALLWPWRDTLDEPLALLTGLLGTAVAAVLIGVLYTLYRVLLEPRLLIVSGAREPSRRECERLLPILEDCARRLGLTTLPRLLMEDDLVLTNARTYARHIVATTSLLGESDEEIAALLSHELVHWRTGDEITSAFVRGVALPLTLVHAVPAWLMRTFPHPGTNFVVFVFFWPVLLTMKYVVLPLHARDVRAAEYRADLGTVLTGHTEGMRGILERRRSFESGRSGWDQAVCATHPPHELRLDRLEAAAAGSTVGAEKTAVPVTTDLLFGRPGPIGSLRTRLVVGALVLAACVGTGWLGVVQWSFFRPQSAVDGYFSALADRDSDAALERLTPEGRASVTDRALLARLVRAEGYQPPTDVTITSIERDDARATAEVSYRLAGQEHTTRLSLSRAESTTAGLFHGWHVENGLPKLDVPAGQVGAMVNGVPVPSSEAGYQLSLLPGGYTATGQGSALSEVAPQPVQLDPGQSQVLSLSPVLKPSVPAAAEERVRAYLDDCAKQPAANPIGCPFQYYSGTVDKISWKIVEYPRLAVELNGPASAGVSTPYEGRGKIRATGTRTYFGQPEPFTDEQELTVSGVLTADGENLTFRPTE